MDYKEKQLLLKDLCARLPYGIFVKENRYSLDDGPVLYTYDYHPCIDNCKPYLRPMSSMTEEENKEIEAIYQKWFLDGGGFGMYVEVIDWLNAHHFDYRGLIEKGLAIEAPENMYNNYMKGE